MGNVGLVARIRTVVKSTFGVVEGLATSEIPEKGRQQCCGSPPSGCGAPHLNSGAVSGLRYMIRSLEKKCAWHTLPDGISPTRGSTEAQVKLDTDRGRRNEDGNTASADIDGRRTPQCAAVL